MDLRKKQFQDRLKKGLINVKFGEIESKSSLLKATATITSAQWANGTFLTAVELKKINRNHSLVQEYLIPYLI